MSQHDYDTQTPKDEEHKPLAMETDNRRLPEVRPVPNDSVHGQHAGGPPHHPHALQKKPEADDSDDRTFIITAYAFQMLFIILYAVAVDYPKAVFGSPGDVSLYAMYQDVHVS